MPRSPCRRGQPWAARQGKDPARSHRELAGNAGIVVFPW
jgi:hypothetical protein